MKKQVKLLFVLAFLLVGVYVTISQREILTLVSRGNTKSYKSYNWSFTTPADLMIPKGTSLPVVGCEDIKTDILIRVEKDGVVYNVSDGSYFLKREKANFFQLLTDPNATYSCKGLFLNELMAILPENA